MIEKDKPVKITVIFPQDLLIKNNTSKNSHLEKIKSCYSVYIYNNRKIIK